MSICHNYASLKNTRALLCDLGNVTIDPLSKKTFDLEGAILKQALKKCLSDRETALKDLADAAKRVDKSGIRSPGRLRSSAPGSPQGSGFYKKLSGPGVRHAKRK
jgi:hypothetical protein